MNRLTLIVVLFALLLLGGPASAQCGVRQPRFPVLHAVFHPFQTVRMIRQGGGCQQQFAPAPDPAETSYAAASSQFAPPVIQTAPPRSSPGGCPGGICPLPRLGLFDLGTALAVGTVAPAAEDAAAEDRRRRVRVALALAE